VGTVRFVALGDSTTEGLGDPVGPGRWRGWAALLATALGSRVHFTNLAVGGATTADVHELQLAPALARRPHLASVLAGGNDVLRGNFDARRSADRLERAVSALRESDAMVLTVRLPDPSRLACLPGPLRRPLAARVDALNEAIDAVAAAYGTVHLDPGADPAAYHRPMWMIDRIHPSERGHRHLARLAAAALATTGWPVHTPPAAEPEGVPAGALGDAWWLATRGTAWFTARSTDFFPYLLAAAAADVWQGTGRRGGMTPVL
jgi:lysophospholipase L1-like esterase